MNRIPTSMPWTSVRCRCTPKICHLHVNATRAFSLTTPRREDEPPSESKPEIPISRVRHAAVASSRIDSLRRKSNQPSTSSDPSKLKLVRRKTANPTESHTLANVVRRASAPRQNSGSRKDDSPSTTRPDGPPRGGRRRPQREPRRRAVTRASEDDDDPFAKPGEELNDSTVSWLLEEQRARFAPTPYEPAEPAPAELQAALPALSDRPTGELEAALRAKSSFWEPEGETDYPGWKKEAWSRMREGEFVKAPVEVRKFWGRRRKGKRPSKKFVEVPQVEQEKLVDRFVRGQYSISGEAGSAEEQLCKNRSYVGVEQEKFTNMLNRIMSVMPSGTGGPPNAAKMVKRKSV